MRIKSQEGREEGKKQGSKVNWRAYEVKEGGGAKKDLAETRRIRETGESR